jgi:hypothetical protein
LTRPAAWASGVAVIVVAVCDVTATMVPSIFRVALLKPVPVIVTDVPPAVVPPVGAIDATVGHAAATACCVTVINNMRTTAARAISFMRNWRFRGRETMNMVTTCLVLEGHNSHGDDAAAHVRR